MTQRVLVCLVTLVLVLGTIQVHAAGANDTCSSRICQRTVHVTANGAGCTATVDFHVLTVPATNRRALLRFDLAKDPSDVRDYRFSPRALRFTSPLDPRRDLVWTGTAPGGDDLGVSDDGQTYLCLDVNTNSRKRLDFDVDVIIDGAATHCASQDPTIDNQG